MNTLLFTTPESKIEAGTFREVKTGKLTGWKVETIPSGSIGVTGSIPSVTVVKVGDGTKPAELTSLISKLTAMQSGISQGSFVLFGLNRRFRAGVQGTGVRSGWKREIMNAINGRLREFPNPDRVDVIELDSELFAKLSLIEAKLKIGPPRPSPLDAVKEAVQATADLRVASGKLSALAVAEVFGISLNKLAIRMGRTRQALGKTPDSDSLQNELAFYEKAARLRALLPADGFGKWLRMANSQLDGKSPLDVLADGKGQVVADLVDDMLTGAPT